MIKFNDNNIFVGYLKQVLSSFNLPTNYVYTADQARHYFYYKKEKDIVPSVGSIVSDPKETKIIKNIGMVPYIKDGYYQYYINGEWQIDPNHLYIENHIDLNYTKTLQIKNNIYDSYTHEYLGDYLRFLRDYNDFDLMPLYNCFSNKICNNISLTAERKTFDCVECTEDGAQTNRYTTSAEIFDSTDKNYKIYMFPVRLFKKYTIALDSSIPVSVCCCLFDKYLNTSPASQYLANSTLEVYNNIAFNRPVLFDHLTEDRLLKNLKMYGGNETSITSLNLHQQTKNIYMMLKMPINAKTSIVVLEGDYINWNNYSYIPKKDTKDEYKIEWQYSHNHFITNYNKYSEHSIFKPISSLQLLTLNTGVSYPFSNRLIEYLLGYAVTSMDTNSDNIERVQKVVGLNNNAYGLDGIWEQKLQAILYDELMRKSLKNNCFEAFITTNDLLGYADKDVSKYYTHTELEVDDITGKIKTNKINIDGVDIYSD